MSEFCPLSLDSCESEYVPKNPIPFLYLQEMVAMDSRRVFSKLFKSDGGPSYGDAACAEVGCKRARIRMKDSPSRFISSDYPVAYLLGMTSAPAHTSTPQRSAKALRYAPDLSLLP